MGAITFHIIRVYPRPKSHLQTYFPGTDGHIHQLNGGVSVPKMQCMGKMTSDPGIFFERMIQCFARIDYPVLRVGVAVLRGRRAVKVNKPKPSVFRVIAGIPHSMAHPIAPYFGKKTQDTFDFSRFPGIFWSK